MVVVGGYCDEVVVVYLVVCEVVLDLWYVVD